MIAVCDVEVMTTNPELAKQIEDLVRQHIDALRASAAAAVARAFAAVQARGRGLAPFVASGLGPPCITTVAAPTLDGAGARRRWTNGKTRHSR